MTVPTNSEGCAVFGLVDPGTFTVAYSRAGWVDPSAVSSVSFTTSVTAGSTNVVTKNYAQAGTINVTVNTAVSGVVSNSLAKAVTVVNAGVPTGTLTFPASPVSGSSSFSLAVYPFPSGYGVWAGGCASGNPTTYGQAAVSAAPGPGAAVAVTVRQPSINITTATGVPGYPGGYTIPSGAHEVFTSISAGCNEKYSQTTGTGGKVPQPGVPYGTYKLCADVSGVYAQLDSFVNQVPAGSSPTISYRGNGTCP
jgi:hypothetical protein